MRLRDAIKKSCDVFFYETARRVGIDRLAAMARRFGFGGVLGIDIPGERPGLIPSREWKFATSGSAWTQGETLIAGIGQGSVLATPLQLATMVARLVTGRAVTPRLVRSEGLMRPGGSPAPGDFPSLGLHPHTLALVLDGMNAVVNEPGGTAYAARIREPGFAMGGKSGTSQVRHISDYERARGVRKARQIPWKERDHALFLAFAPGRRAALCVRDGRRAWRHERRRRLGRRGADLPRRLAGGATARSRPAGSRRGGGGPGEPRRGG